MTINYFTTNVSFIWLAMWQLVLFLFHLQVDYCIEGISCFWLLIWALATAFNNIHLLSFVIVAFEFLLGFRYSTYAVEMYLWVT